LLHVFFVKSYVKDIKEYFVIIKKSKISIGYIGIRKKKIFYFYNVLNKLNNRIKRIMNENFKFLKIFDNTGIFIIISLIKYFMFRKTILANDFFYTLISYFNKFNKDTQVLIIKEFYKKINCYDDYNIERFEFFINKKVDIDGK
jgi:hypothetical protein